MTDVAHVDARLNSLFDPGFTPEGRVLMDAKGVTPTPGLLPEAPAVKIRNGRELQRQSQTDASFTEAGFFDEHSFVLLDHASNVQNWNSDPEVPPTGDGHRPHLLPGNRDDYPRASVAGLPRRDSSSAVSASPRPGNAQSLLRHRRPSGLRLERRRLRRERRRLRHRRGRPCLAQAVRPGRGGGLPRHQLLANRLHGRTAPPPAADDLRSVLGGSGRRSLHGTAQTSRPPADRRTSLGCATTRSSAGTTIRP